MPETDNVQSLGDSTHRWKIYGTITGSLDKTFKVKLNNTQYTYDGSADIDLSTIYAPTAGGTAGYVLVGAGATATPAWHAGLTLAGTAAASYIASFSGTTASTSTTTGAVKIAGGLGVAGQVTAARVGINGSDTSYTLYVNGTTYIKHSSASNARPIISGTRTDKHLSIGNSGFQTYNNNTESLLYLNYYGGAVNIGSASTATATRDFYGMFDFHSADGFTYSGIGAASANSSRPVWFSYGTNITGRPVYDDDFQYNPALNRIDLIHASGTGGEYRVTYGSTVDMWLGIGSGDENHGLYDAKAGKWMISADISGNVTVNGYSINANINSGTKDYIAYYSGKNTISQTAHAHFNWTELSGTTKGREELVLGDKTNQFGRLALYGKADASGGAYIVANNASSWLTHTFPDTAGWIVTAGNGSSTGAGAADRPIYVSADGVATQTTYRMAGTNANATTGLTFSDDLNTGIWYVNGITADEDKASLYNQSDGAIIANRYNNNWISEIYQDYRTGQLAIRGKNSGTWQPWRKVLDSTNYTLYSGNARIFYGTCSTAAATAEKDVTCTAYDALTVGDVIFVTFANTNSGAVGSLKLDVNGKGAKPIKYLGNATKSNLPSAGYIIANTPYRFVYDGTNWVMDLYYNTNTVLRTYASATNIDVPLIGQSSAASTTAAWSTYSGTHKDWYGVIPNDDTKRAKINLSTGAMTVPGGITSGKFIANHVNGGNQEFLIRYNDEDIMSLELGTGNVNHGIYDYKNNKWMIYADNSGNINMNGNALTANAISPAGNSGQFWRGDNTWNNTINSYIGSYRESTTAQNWPSGIYFTTKDTTTTNSATGYIYCYQDHGSPSWGLNMVIQPTGNLIIGSGESPGSFYANAILGKTVNSNETTVGASSASFMENGEQTIITSDSRIYFFTNCNTIDNRNLSYIDTNGYYWGTRVYGAVWNDYAEYRKTQENIQPGRCIKENGDDSLSITTKRLERGCEIVSDTFGFAIGENNESKTPTAASGRVLAYPYESREEFASHIGWPVCSGPNGTVSIMTEEEEEKYPSRIIGTISAVPDYEEWGTGNVKVDGRVWIRIR